MPGVTNFHAKEGSGGWGEINLRKQNIKNALSYN